MSVWLEILRVLKSGLKEVKSVDVMCEREGKLLETEAVLINQISVIKLGQTLQTSIPTISGFYSEFSGVIPVDNELGSRNEKSRGDFGMFILIKQVYQLSDPFGTLALILLLPTPTSRCAVFVTLPWVCGLMKIRKDKLYCARNYQ